MNGKKDNDLPWADLQYLLVVARAGSFLAAGRAAGVSTSTMSRRISHLEQAAGTPLVERGVEGVRLTEAGQRLVATAETMEHQVGAALRDLPTGSGVLRGRVRLTLGDGFVAGVTELLAVFARAHPGIDVEIHSENTVSSLRHREFDLAIRTVHGDEDLLVYRKLGVLGYGLYASPSYLDHHGTPHSFDDLKAHRLIGFSQVMRGAEQMQALRQAGVTRYALTVNTFAGMVEGVHAGVGIAPLPHMTSGYLVPVVPDFKPRPMDVYFVGHPSALKQPHIRAFADALSAAVKQSLSASRKAPM
ncbi:MAG: LysR family transcriptional regulator [Parvibaculaceae bacterium]